MTRESGGGGSNHAKETHPDYRSRAASVGDNRGPGLDSAAPTVHTNESAYAWNREYARMYGMYDPVRAGAYGDPSIVAQDGPDAGVNIDPTIPDPMYNSIGVDGGILGDRRRRAGASFMNYEQLGQELERRHRETVQAAHDLFLQREQARQMAQIALVIGDVWKKVYPDRQMPQALAQGGGGVAGRLNQFDGGGGSNGAQSLPTNRIPPIFPGTDPGDWLDETRDNQEHWDAEQQDRKDRQVFAAGSANADNDYERIQAQRAQERAAQPAQRQAAQQQRTTRMSE